MFTVRVGYRRENVPPFFNLRLNPTEHLHCVGTLQAHLLPLSSCHNLYYFNILSRMEAILDSSFQLVFAFFYCWSSQYITGQPLLMVGLCPVCRELKIHYMEQFVYTKSNLPTAENRVFADLRWFNLPPLCRDVEEDLVVQDFWLPRYNSVETLTQRGQWNTALQLGVKEKFFIISLW